MNRLLLMSLSCSMLAACSIDPQVTKSDSESNLGSINPDSWPYQKPVMERDAQAEAKIQNLLNRMTIEEKVGQVIQADIAHITPSEAREYNLGSILNGGSSAPGGDNRAAPEKWLALADEFWKESTDVSDGGVGIPLLWGTDAVHGHSNILGATIFPHNIGLGMANEPDIMEDIGRITAIEMRVTGFDWTFAPTIAVVRNDRWGRTYESFSEDPAIVAAYAPRYVEGFQGKIGSPDFLTNGHMIATAKHFAGDGGTVDGIDQGNNVTTEDVLRNQQAAAYPPAIAAGVQSVMASFNSYHGKKLHGHKEMLTDVLVGRMGFDGFVVGDWNGHGQVEGCTNTSCAQSFNAGLDMFMAPDSWKGLYETLLKQVESNIITEQRLNEAVARILRVKIRSGLFDAGLPSSRPYAGDYQLLGSNDHRAIARDAVRKSLVLLKNEQGLLPLNKNSTVLMTGDGAHNIGKQSGGWTLNWQGTDNLREHFPNGSSIYEGFVEALGEDQVFLSENGDYTVKPDVAVVVFGEDPYAEFQGDRLHVDYTSEDGLSLLKKYQKEGIKTVAVFLSGRPMFVNPELNAADAFVAAWLPGTEGAGVADVLVGNENGEARFDFTGRLSFSWPRSAVQVEVNVGDENYDPLFAYGYGLSYQDNISLGTLSEDSGLGDMIIAEKGSFLEYGDPVGEWNLILRDPQGDTRIGDSQGTSASGAIDVYAADKEVQEDSIIVTWRKGASLLVEGRPIDLLRESNGDMVIGLTYSVIEAPTGTVSISMGENDKQSATIDITAGLKENADKGWTTGYLRLSCFSERDLDMTTIKIPLEIKSDGPLKLQIASAKVVANSGSENCAL